MMRMRKKGMSQETLGWLILGLVALFIFIGLFVLFKDRGVELIGNMFESWF
jgi:hypothetical protein